MITRLPQQHYKMVNFSMPYVFSTTFQHFFVKYIIYLATVSKGVKILGLRRALYAHIITYLYHANANKYRQIIDSL